MLPTWMPTLLRSLLEHAHRSLGWISSRTGVPHVVITAIALVVGLRLLKKTARFGLEVAAVAMLLGLAAALVGLRF